MAFEAILMREPPAHVLQLVAISFAYSIVALVAWAFTSYCLEITDKLKEYNDKLQSATEVKSRFLANISHGTSVTFGSSPHVVLLLIAPGRSANSHARHHLDDSSSAGIQHGRPQPHELRENDRRYALANQCLAPEHKTTLNFMPRLWGAFTGDGQRHP